MKSSNWVSQDRNLRKPCCSGLRTEIAFQVIHQGADDDMFQNLAWDTCDGYGALVCKGR